MKMARPTCITHETSARTDREGIDPTYTISHRITLEQAPETYKVWRDKKENVTKIVIDPWSDVAA
ncbi:threonine dehydrogenase-like Zn-dependent dehydrogenase [Edaphobacter lichenicola]|uniref:Threonine dehydrogenase-like Zn-dependent dehydrogenase n=1 Tax=Tunturiibacter gelidiferens TaxID=3069689 RepID=A0A9X0QFU7_9BACT|nr:threonine dehydrogenase-like Zn-dependent dehydrogenase [Edaphobacter lichenicola]